MVASCPAVPRTVEASSVNPSRAVAVSRAGLLKTTRGDVANAASSVRAGRHWHANKKMRMYAPSRNEVDVQIEKIKKLSKKGGYAFCWPRVPSLREGNDAVTAFCKFLRLDIKYGNFP